MYKRQVYDIGNYSFKCQSVFTNAVPTDAYRGAGRPEATYAIERAMDALARKMGVTPEEIRRRNYIQPEQFPYTNPTGAIIMDSGNYEPTMARALEMAGIDELRAEQQRRRDAGDTKVLGIGICTCLLYTSAPGVRPLLALQAMRNRREAAALHLHLDVGIVGDVQRPSGMAHTTPVAADDEVAPVVVPVRQRRCPGLTALSSGVVQHHGGQHRIGQTNPPFGDLVDEPVGRRHRPLQYRLKSPAGR